MMIDYFLMLPDIAAIDTFIIFAMLYRQPLPLSPPPFHAAAAAFIDIFADYYFRLSRFSIDFRFFDHFLRCHYDRY